MRKINQNIFLLISIFIFTNELYACPFCEFGGSDVAIFILLVFGSLSLGMLCLFFATYKKDVFDNNAEVVNSVLIAEGYLKKDTLEAEEEIKKDE